MPLAQSFGERVVVDDGAAAHIDEDAVRAEGAKNRGVDHMPGLGGAGDHDEERVDPLGHGAKVGEVLVGDARSRAPGMIDDRDVHRVEAARDGEADPAEADDADGAAREASPG